MEEDEEHFMAVPEGVPGRHSGRKQVADSETEWRECMAVYDEMCREQ